MANVENNKCGLIANDLRESFPKEIVFYSSNLLPKEYVQKHHFVYMERWLVPNFTNVSKGDKVIEVKDSFLPTFMKGYTFKYSYIRAPHSGILVRKANYIELKEGNILFELYPNEKSLLEKYPNEIEVSNDDFTRDIVIKGKLYGGNQYGFKIGVILTFESINGSYYILVRSDSTKGKLDKKSSFQMLLNDGTVITLFPASKPVKIFSGCYTVKYKISWENLVSLSLKLFLKWRITTDDGNIVSSGYNCFFPVEDTNDISLDLSYNVFQNFVSLFIAAVKDNVKDYDSNIKVENISCYVYLMVDTANNFYKIGISNRPGYREHTLQSEKPTIELLCAKEYPTRVIAEAIESALHKAFASKRIRGEWFNLSLVDVLSIKETLR